MSHSKRNTSLAFFTSYERSLLKGTWGSQSTRLTRDSYLPFGSCQLCLQIARDPVACAVNGEIFCRECAVNNLLAQRKEIQRLEKEMLKGQVDADEEAKQRDEEAKTRSVLDFEKTMMGLEAKTSQTKQTNVSEAQAGAKRKREDSDLVDDMSSNAVKERTRARRALDDEKAAEAKLPSFWVPSLTPSTKKDLSSLPVKLNPLCPASTPTNKHALSLKSLITLHLDTPKASKPQVQPSASKGQADPICPACTKQLSNSIKAIMTVPCGHVLCKPCAQKFMSKDDRPPDPHVSDQEAASYGKITCYVCAADLGGDVDPESVPGKKKKGSSKAVKAGLVELKSDGTGFAGGGDNMVQRQGTAFQC